MSALSRTLRPRDLLLLFIGSVIGSGIFLTPGLILRQLNGSVGAASLVWIVGGVLSLLGALTYAELSATNPEAGGLYCFIRDGFGRIPAFLYGWSLFLVIASGTIAALAHAFTRYLAEVIPFPTAATKFIAVAMIAVVTAVNVWGTRKSSDLQNWTTLIKALAVVVLSIVLLVLGHHAHEIPAAIHTTQNGAALFSAFGLAMIAVLWAYEGWQFGTYSAGEVIDPQKAFPRAFLIGSLILVALYLTANVAYLIALGPAAATASDAIAATAASSVLGPWAGKFVALDHPHLRFQLHQQRHPHRPARFLRDGQRQSLLQKISRSPPALRHSRERHHRARRLVRHPRLRQQVRRSRQAAQSSSAGFSTASAPPPSSRSAAPIQGKAPIPYRVPGYPFTPFLFVLAAAAIVINAIVLAFYDPASFQHILVAIILFLLGLPAYAFWRRHSATNQICPNHAMGAALLRRPEEVHRRSPVHAGPPSIRSETFPTRLGVQHSISQCLSLALLRREGSCSKLPRSQNPTAPSPPFTM